MKTKFISYILFAIVLFWGLQSCEEKEWSEDYDINYPVSTITAISPLQQKSGGEVTISGTNLDLVSFVSLGNLRCTIKSKNSATIIVTIPNNAQKNFVSVENIFMRKFVYEKGIFVPIP